MRVHKRKKNSRIRGSKTAFYGFRQKHKGHGNHGGFGLSGTGKRGDHKRQWAKNVAKKAGAKSYFGKQGYTSRGTSKKKYDKINLSDIKANFSGSKIDLSTYKILAKGEGFKAEITAKSASASAIEKMEKAGGKIILLEKTFDEEEIEEEAQEEKLAKKESKKETSKKESKVSEDKKAPAKKVSKKKE